MIPDHIQTAIEMEAPIGHARKAFFSELRAWIDKRLAACDCPECKGLEYVDGNEGPPIECPICRRRQDKP